MADANYEALLLYQGNELIDSVGTHVLRCLLKQLVYCKYQATFSELVKVNNSNDPRLYERQKQFKQVFSLKYFKADQVAAIKTGLVKIFDIPLLKKLIRTEIISGYIVNDGRWNYLEKCVESNSHKSIDEMWQPLTTEDQVAGGVLVLQYWRNELAHRKVPEAYKPGEIQAMRRNIEATVWSLAGMLGIDDEELFQDEKSHCMKIEPDKIFKYVRDSPKQECNLVIALPGKDLRLNLKTDYLMPMVFTAKEKYETDMYKHVSYNNDLDQVIQELVNGKRVVLCEGDAGMGKTIICKRLVSSYYSSESDFVNKLKNVRQFDLLFYIPVRHIDTKAKLIDLICCEEDGMGYVKPYMRETVKNILHDSEMGSKVLILLDGVDEREIPEGSDMYKLIIGETYPSVKLMIATRPEANILTKLGNFGPDLKIQLKGTNDDGVKEYLRKTLVLNKEVNVNKEVVNILKRCKEKMVDYSILHVPLYLALIKYILEEHSNRGNKSLESFTIPDSMTELFKEFLLLVICIWLERSGRLEEASSLTFDKNPFDKRSTIPVDIKRILKCFAEMSYHCLLDEVYDFSNDHLQDYDIGSEELKASGFFAWSEVDGQLAFCFTHKQFQEYFAALHIAHSGYNTESFRERMDKAKNIVDKKQLREIFKKLENTMKFVFGLNSDFSVKLLKEVKEHTSLSEDNSYDPNLHFELQLCAESYSPRVHQTMAELLLSAEVKLAFKDTINIGASETPFRLSEVRSMMEIAENFDPNQRILLMKRWFDITVELKNKTVKQELDCFKKYKAVIISDNPTKLDSYCFRHILFILMVPFVFHDVKELSFFRSEVSDVSLLYGVSFPCLHSVNINTAIMDDNLTIDLIGNVIREKFMTSNLQNSSDGRLLKNVSVGLPMSACSINSLQKLNNLQVLKMTLFKIDLYSNSITDILSHTPALTELFILYVRFSKTIAYKNLQLLADAIDKLRYLKIIYLTFNICDGDIDTFFGYVKQWRNVESLGLHAITVCVNGDKVAQGLKFCPNIKEIIVCDDDDKIYWRFLSDFCQKLRPDLKLSCISIGDLYYKNAELCLKPLNYTAD